LRGDDLVARLDGGDALPPVIGLMAKIGGREAFVPANLIAQLGPADMRLPIQYALSYPERWPNPFRRADLPTVGHLDFAEPDVKRFPSLRLAREAGVANGQQRQGRGACPRGRCGRARRSRAPVRPSARARAPECAVGIPAERARDGARTAGIRGGAGLAAVGGVGRARSALRGGPRGAGRR